MDINETKLFYDLTAENTADEWYPNTVLMPTIEEFVSFLPEKPRVLDLGCGPGYESMRLASVGAEVVGVDFSSESIRIARDRCPECQFVESDFRQFDNSLGLFDGVHVHP
jgi:ubiquinone/menaquinone biosynthesis C-methylase UbiE